MTPLDLSQIEVFLRIFWEFFIFWNLNLNFEWSVFLTLRGSGMATAAVEAGARRRRCQDGRHGAGEAAGEQREKLRGRLTGDEERRASSGSSQMTNGVFFS